VLVVDDQASLRKAFSRMLSSEFTVVEASSAIEAMKILESGTRVDAVLCDLNLGETSGIALHADIKSKNPGLAERTIFVTGGATNESAAFIKEHSDRVIRKPPRSGLVLQRVRMLFDEFR
jgi:CheY-like chemotaxis protein